MGTFLGRALEPSGACCRLQRLFSPRHSAQTPTASSPRLFDLQCKKSGRGEPVPLVPGPTPGFGVLQPCHIGARPCPCSGFAVLHLSKAGTQVTRATQVTHPSGFRCHLHPTVAFPTSGAPHRAPSQQLRGSARSGTWALRDTGTPSPPRREPDGSTSAVPPGRGCRPAAPAQLLTG